MEKIFDEILTWCVNENLPYVRKLNNNLYEIFTGTSKMVVGEELYKKFNEAMQKEGEKYLNKKP